MVAAWVSRVFSKACFTGPPDVCLLHPSDLHLDTPLNQHSLELDVANPLQTFILQDELRPHGLNLLNPVQLLAIM